MEVHLSPDLQAKFEQMARDSGCRNFDEFANTREMLDR
jgi:hypothetical protein